MLEAKIDQDLKQSLLGGDKIKTEVLRGLKSVFLNEKIAKGQRDTGLSDEQVLALIGKEVKKRSESAELYAQVGADDRAKAEVNEKTILEEYLPKQLSDEALQSAVQSVVDKLGAGAQLGQVIGAVKQKVGAEADGARVAAAVKTTLGL